MIKFFRRIRQNLLSAGKTGKYLKYAIGEIILVVIGILIALQINNWNEARKQNLRELALLKELKADLIFSIEEIDTVSFYNLENVKAYEQIRLHILNDSTYNKALDDAFGQLDNWSEPYLPNMAYDAINNKGIDVISNDSLKKHISKVYNFNLKMLLENMGAWEWSFNQNTTQRFMVKYIRRVPGASLASPVDFEVLKTDDEFLNFLSVLIAIRKDNVEISKQTGDALKKLVEHIDQELVDRS
ncbi:MAG: hypothetical protein KJO63_04830 [Maribacter sp.]|nr:hypothetical protein [Maribacter sp.]NNK19088.1 hypothetical protein [Maribacter sp.]